MSVCARVCLCVCVCVSVCLSVTTLAATSVVFTLKSRYVGVCYMKFKVVKRSYQWSLYTQATPTGVACYTVTVT